MRASEREDALKSVLSPRTAPVVKGSGPVPVHNRRSMVETGARETPPMARGHVRQSSIVPGSAGGRGGKGVWR